jgi:hypothetical protein
MAIARVKAMEQVEDLARFGDGVADGTKLIVEALQLGAVLIDGHVALIGTTELSLEVDGTLELVVAKEPFDGVPEQEGGEVGSVDDVEH